MWSVPVVLLLALFAFLGWGRRCCGVVVVSVVGGCGVAVGAVVVRETDGGGWAVWVVAVMECRMNSYISLRFSIHKEDTARRDPLLPREKKGVVAVRVLSPLRR